MYVSAEHRDISDDVRICDTMEYNHRRFTDRSAVRAGIDLWNRVHPDFEISDRLVEQNVFAPFAGLDVTAWGTVADGDLVAFVLGKRLIEEIPDYADSEQGWVSLFVSDPALEDSGVGSLLATVEQAMSDRGVSHLRFGGDPGQFLPGLPADFTNTRRILREQEFENRGTMYDLQGDLTGFDSPVRVDRVRSSWPELSLERVETTETLLSFLADQFPGRWQYEAANICRLPGGGTEYWLLHHGEPAVPVGFARTNTPDSSYRGGNINWASRLDGTVCGLGPLGIHESYRKRGWGLWMIATLAERYRKIGYDRMIIDWTDLPEYYGKLGFEPWLTYETFTKELSS